MRSTPKNAGTSLATHLRSPSSQRKECGFDPLSGNQGPTCLAVNSNKNKHERWKNTDKTHNTEGKEAAASTVSLPSRRSDPTGDTPWQPRRPRSISQGCKTRWICCTEAQPSPWGEPCGKGPSGNSCFVLQIQKPVLGHSSDADYFCVGDGVSAGNVPITPMTSDPHSLQRLGHLRCPSRPSSLPDSLLPPFHDNCSQHLESTSS